MKNMTYEEIKGMVGTEFKYVFDCASREEIAAVVAAVDFKVGFTCLATELVTSGGTNLSDHLDANGNFCVVGVHRERTEGADAFMEEVSVRLRLIKNLGYYKEGAANGFGESNGIGTATCAFQ